MDYGAAIALRLNPSPSVAYLDYASHKCIWVPLSSPAALQPLRDAQLLELMLQTGSANPNNVLIVLYLWW